MLGEIRQIQKWLAFWLAISALLFGLAVLKLRWFGCLDLPTGRFFFAEQMALIWGIGFNACWLVLANLIKKLNFWVNTGCYLFNIFLLFGVCQILLGGGSGLWGDGISAAFHLPMMLAAMLGFSPFLFRLLNDWKVSKNDFEPIKIWSIVPGVWAIWIWAIGVFAYGLWIALPAVMGQMVSSWMLGCAQNLICLPIAAVAMSRFQNEKSFSVIEQTALYFLVLFGPLAGTASSLYLPVPHFLVAIGQVGQVGVILAGVLFLVSWRKTFLFKEDANQNFLTISLLRFVCLGVGLKILLEVASLIPGIDSLIQFSPIVLVKDWVCFGCVLLPAAWSLLDHCFKPASRLFRRSLRLFGLGISLILGALLVSSVFYANAVSDYTNEWEQVVQALQVPALLVPIGCVMILASSLHFFFQEKRN